MIRIEILAKKLRARHWIKNSILFLPLLQPNIQFDSVLITAFAAFCFAASANYILNDKFDVEADQEHPIKKSRYEDLSEQHKILKDVNLIFFFSGAALILGFQVGLLFGSIVLVFLLFSLFYTIFFKKINLISIPAVVLLYFFRAIGGYVALNSNPDFMLIFVLMMFFFYLAIVKRSLDAALRKNPKTDKTTSSSVISPAFRQAVFLIAGAAIAYFIAALSRAPNLQIFLGLVLVAMFHVELKLINRKIKGIELIDLFLNDRVLLLVLFLSAGTVFVKN